MADHSYETCQNGKDWGIIVAKRHGKHHAQPPQLKHPRAPDICWKCTLSVGQEKKLGVFDDEDEVQGCVAVSTPLLSTAMVCRLKNETVHTLRKVLRRWEMGVKSKAG